MVKIMIVFIAIQYFIFLFTVKDKSVRLLVRTRACTHLSTGCSGAGTRRNGVPTPFQCFALKWVWSCFEMAIFWVRSHTFYC